MAAPMPAASAPAAAADEETLGFLGVGPLRRLNFARPSSYEACVVTQASLWIAMLFWGISLWGAISGHGTAGIVENCLESFLDFASTAVVLYRLTAFDSLRQTPRNEIVERRTQVSGTAFPPLPVASPSPLTLYGIASHDADRPRRDNDRSGWCVHHLRHCDSL